MAWYDKIDCYIWLDINLQHEIYPIVIYYRVNFTVALISNWKNLSTDFHTAHTHARTHAYLSILGNVSI